jgi:FAD/FMN-containing dehydrogenase
MDKSILDHTRQSAALEALRRSFIEGDPGSLLCVEFYADRAEELPPRLDALERDLRAHHFGYRYHHAIDLAAQARIWSLREAGLGLSMAMKDDAKSLSFVEDTAVEPEKLRDYIDGLRLERWHVRAGLRTPVGCSTAPCRQPHTDAGPCSKRPMTF